VPAKLGLARETSEHRVSEHRPSSRQLLRAQRGPPFGEEGTVFPSYATVKDEPEWREGRKNSRLVSCRPNI
jgi:hypothetical protein